MVTDPYESENLWLSLYKHLENSSVLFYAVQERFDLIQISKAFPCRLLRLYSFDRSLQVIESGKLEQFSVF